MTVQEENSAIDATAEPININYKAIVPCDESMRLATKLGTHFERRLTQVQIEECLRDKAVAVYPLERVQQFMDAKVKALKASRPEEKYFSPSWGWYPLRAADLQRPARGIGSTTLKRYTKPVPIEVMLMVEAISDALGPQVRFYVGDITREDVMVDHFLCVTADGCPIYVIERWDEPAFRS